MCTDPWGDGDGFDGDEGTEEDGNAAPAMKVACSSGVDGMAKCVKKCPTAAAGNGDMAVKRGEEGTGPSGAGRDCVA